MSAATRRDVIVLGAGMAGASLAAELSDESRVTLIEIEEQPGRHATGRSAAMFFESYGNTTIRALTRASRNFLEFPPSEFAHAPFLSLRGCLIVAARDRYAKLDDLQSSSKGSLIRVDTEEARRLVPILRESWLGGALADDSGSDIDVAALLQAYLRKARRSSVEVVLDAGEVRLDREGDAWRVRTRGGDWMARVVVNACGAWADVVAEQAGVAVVGLQPMRRTAILIPPPDNIGVAAWPAVVDVDETFYFKPDDGQLLVSPANEDPTPPCDAAPDELDIAVAVDRFETATTHAVQRIAHRWSGLRSFMGDRTPVVGFAPHAPGFFWFAGQGGYGIQTAPAMARIGAALICGRSVPEDIAAQGASEQALSPSRPALQRAIGRG